MAQWKRTHLVEPESTYPDAHYYRASRCFCNEDQDSGYTFQDEHGNCDYCTGHIRAINGSNAQIRDPRTLKI